MSFKVGDLAVYPAHGVGKIEAVEEKKIAGDSHHFYVMRILDSDMKIMIPTNNVKSVGLRQVINKTQITKIFDILKGETLKTQTQNWNRRYREYTEKIKTGSIYEVAEVMRDLSVLRGAKELSFGERKMLDTARDLLVKEIAVAKDQTEDKVEKEISVLFKTEMTIN